MRKAELVIIGAGPAGLCAAAEAYKAGVRDILIIERDKNLGGILQQCIHNGFGLHRFHEELTGPEYAHRCEEAVRQLPITIQCETTVTAITPDKKVFAVSRANGAEEIQAKAIILAMGCRERPRGALGIAGTRPAGIFSAGTAQKYVNMLGYMPGREVVILGSGDIGLIMARRMTLEGAKVHAVCEIMPCSSGLERNLQQCLRDFDIPLYLRHTVSEIHGKDRLCGVTISEVDEALKPIAGTERYIPCDTLLLSVGLIPENELSQTAGIVLSPVTKGAVVDQNRQTSVEGIFACGNVLQVHDLADFVSEEAEIAASAAARYIREGKVEKTNIEIKTDGKVRYTVPQRITDTSSDVKLFFRVGAVYENARVRVQTGDTVLCTMKKAKMAPGEMQTIVLRADMLEGATSPLEIAIDL